MTTHTHNVTVPGWSGAGYIVIDPKSGDGAYVISGGSNGGFAQVVYGIYAFLYLVWNYIDVATAVSVLFSKFLSEILGIIGDIKDIINMYKNCGRSGAVQLGLFTLMFTMMMTILTGVTFLLLPLLVTMTTFAAATIAGAVGMLALAVILNRMQHLIARSRSCSP